jgi:hypothetical protein
MAGRAGERRTRSPAAAYPFSSPCRSEVQYGGIAIL